MQLLRKGFFSPLSKHNLSISVQIMFLKQEKDLSE